MIEGTTSLPIGTTYNITVGSAGAAPTSGADGGDGGDTTFNGLTAVGGGGGGGFKTAGRSGGSGGGGGGRESYAGGSSTQTGGFGNAGGAAHPNNNAQTILAVAEAVLEVSEPLHPHKMVVQEVLEEATTLQERLCFTQLVQVAEVKTVLMAAGSTGGVEEMTHKLLQPDLHTALAVVEAVEITVGQMGK